jgi:hypothetical protein
VAALTRPKADPERAERADDFTFGRVWGRQRRTRDERMALAVSSLTATGHLDSTKDSVHTAPGSDDPLRKPHQAIPQDRVYCGFPSTVQVMHSWARSASLSCSYRRRPTGRQEHSRPVMKCAATLAGVDALIDLGPPAPWREMLKEHFEDEGGYRKASHQAELPVLSWLNRYGINRISCARNSFNRPLVRASDSQTAISAFKWWAA